MWAPVLRLWLYLFADTALWLAVMSRTETLVEERGARSEEHTSELQSH